MPITKEDMLEMENTAMKIFNYHAERAVKFRQYSTESLSAHANAVAVLMQGITAVRAQRLAEEAEENTIHPSIKKPDTSKQLP